MLMQSVSEEKGSTTNAQGEIRTQHRERTVWTLSFFYFFLVLVFLMSAQRGPVTVPCKYKTGKVLGNGTYATVKGELLLMSLFTHAS